MHQQTSWLQNEEYTWRMPSSGMWHCVDVVWTNVSEEHIVRYVDRRLQSPAHAGSSCADFSTLKIEAIRSSQTSIHTRSTHNRMHTIKALKHFSIITSCPDLMVSKKCSHRFLNHMVTPYKKTASHPPPYLHNTFWPPPPKIITVMMATFSVWQNNGKHSKSYTVQKPKSCSILSLTQYIIYTFIALPSTSYPVPKIKLKGRL
jgi:hypothetical protein